LALPQPPIIGTVARAIPTSVTPSSGGWKTCAAGAGAD
jgi:hypothetical protein